MKFLLRQHITILLAIFIIMASFGVQLGMNSFSAGAESPCPFNGDLAAICPMSVVNHISFWKQIFSALPAGESLALFIIAVLIVSFRFKALIKTAETRLIFWYRYHKKTSSREKIYNYFSFLFAQGILHPKLYA